MWQSKDYRDKYGPMLYLLNSERDYEYLASKAGYRAEFAHDYRDMQRRSLRAYLLDLEADINELRLSTISACSVAFRDMCVFASRSIGSFPLPGRKTALEWDPPFESWFGRR
jgi:hypothetical protein